MELQDWLIALLGSGALGALAAGAWTLLEEEFPALCGARYWVKRLAVWLIASGLGVMPYLIMVAMEYEPVPATWRGWIEKLFYYAFIAVAVSQGLHAGSKSKAPAYF